MVYLLVGYKNKNGVYLDRAIEYSFNNKEARTLKSIFKLIEGKKI